MKAATKYISKPPCPKGFVTWDAWENKVWNTLITRQAKAIEGRACKDYINGLKILNLPTDRIPQLPEISEVLTKHTGWKIEPVPALISFDKFFKLLSEKKFPSATFIRTQEELDYLQEPDIFHEIYGHCALLTNPYFADFTARYGELGAKATDEERRYLARLYWFTVEFGLIKEDDQMKIFGGGILSSIGETKYSLEDPSVDRRPMEMLDALRTPYRIDIMQPIYYYIKSM